MRRVLRLLALSLLATLAFPAASAVADDCVREAGYAVCPLLSNEWGSRYGIEAHGDAGTHAEFTVAQGTGFFGDYLYAIAIVEAPGVARAHGGFGATDGGFDGMYENYCVCGALQTTFLYVPYGVGLEDTDGDGFADSAYVEPQL